MAQRKTEDEWQVHMFTAEGWEEIDCGPTWQQARDRIKEYRENQPGNYKLKKVRVPITPTPVTPFPTNRAL